MSSAPITNVQPTNPPYFWNLADGQKKMAPVWCWRLVKMNSTTTMGRAAYRESKGIDRDGCLAVNGDVGFSDTSILSGRPDGSYLVSIFLHLTFAHL